LGARLLKLVRRFSSVIYDVSRPTAEKYVFHSLLIYFTKDNIHTSDDCHYVCYESPFG
jgi:hypothetical protein